MVTLKHNLSHVRRHTLPSQPSQHFITQFRHNMHNLSPSLAAPKANTIFHAANKNLFLKTPFDYCHLTSSSFYLYYPYKLRFGLVSLFNGISTPFRLFNAKAILLEQYWYYLTYSWEDKGVHTFPKGICSEVNVIARQEYELTYYDSAVQRF